VDGCVSTLLRDEQLRKILWLSILDCPSVVFGLESGGFLFTFFALSWFFAVFSWRLWFFIGLFSFCKLLVF